MNFKKITALSLALALSVGITANAATSLPSTEKSEKEGTKIELRKGIFKKHKHHGGLYKTAEEMGITKDELKDAKKNGKNFFELAKTKGYTEQQVKELMIKNKSESIDKAVENGKITKEKAEEFKSKMKEKILNWDGSFRKHKNLKKDNTKENKD